MTEPFNSVSASCVSGPRLEQVEETATPPSIADMAPGTTFTEASNGWPRSAWTVGQRHDGTKYVKRQSDGWTVLDLDYFDPSTIRDVTPPSGGADGG